MCVEFRPENITLGNIQTDMVLFTILITNVNDFKMAIRIIFPFQNECSLN